MATGLWSLYILTKILNAKTLLANFYTPTSKMTILIPKIPSYLTDKINPNNPAYVIIATDANIRLDMDNLTTTKKYCLLPVGTQLTECIQIQISKQRSTSWLHFSTQT